MALPAASSSARAAKWRQLVDILAQARGQKGERAAEAFRWLRSQRGAIGRSVRREIADSLAGRAVTADLLHFFAEDHPSVAAPLLAGARLSPGEWIDLLPSLTPTARALLRHRRDLDAKVVQALSSFGASDFALPGSIDEGAGAGRAAADPGVEGGEAQIRELVARIEAFRKHRAAAPAEEALPAPEPVEAFRWETGADGLFLWVEDAPRSALVGQSIASIGGPGHHGVDGQAAGAFERRSPFRDARFSVAGAGPSAGDWRISGVPFFNLATGAFLGYRGTARRPRLDEVARAQAADAPAGLFGTGLPADSLLQLSHELRTPLNAIVGFAEMIDGQYMGPAGAGYRSRAADIMAHASRLLAAVDDLDTAARIETSRLPLDPEAIDAAALLRRLHDAYEAVAAERRARIELQVAPGLPPVKAEPAALERMFTRLLGAAIGLAREGETISAGMAAAPLGGRSMLCFAIDRPKAIAGLEEAAMLDPGYSPEGDWPGAPALGLGFALRLVRNLADAMGGGLIIDSERFSLYLPPFQAAERSSGQSS